MLGVAGKGSKPGTGVATREFQDYHSGCLVGSELTAMGGRPVRVGGCQLQSRQKGMMAWVGVRSREKATCEAREPGGRANRKVAEVTA